MVQLKVAPQLTRWSTFFTIGSWHQDLDNSESVRVMFIDYAKAFDHVDHSTLVRKLYNFNVPQFLICWLCSFLTNRMQRVKLSEYNSEWLTL